VIQGTRVCEEVRIYVCELGELEEVLYGRRFGINRGRAYEGGHCGDGDDNYNNNAGETSECWRRLAGRVRDIKLMRIGPRLPSLWRLVGCAMPRALQPRHIDMTDVTWLSMD
jgi:hypothetical protein